MVVVLERAALHHRRAAAAVTTAVRADSAAISGQMRGALDPQLLPGQSDGRVEDVMRDVVHVGARDDYLDRVQLQAPGLVDADGIRHLENGMPNCQRSSAGLSTDWTCR